MKSHSETGRLYVSADKNKEGVYFARTDQNLFARFYQNQFGWEIYIYPYKVRYREKTLTDSMKRIDYVFKKFWEEKCDTQLNEKRK